jgi:putative endopeptidase
MISTSPIRTTAPRRVTRRSLRRALAALVPLLLAVALAARGQTAGDLDPRRLGAWGIDLTDQDPSIRPGDDFYRYQNGAWLARTELAPGTTGSAYWRDVRLLAPRRLAAMLEELAARPADPGTPEGKAGAFYRAFVDQAAVDELGASPLAPELAALAAARNRSELAGWMGRIEGPETIRTPSAPGLLVGRGFFRVDVVQDPGDPAACVVALGQAGLMLPGPEYSSEPQFADVREAYRAYAEELLGLVGWPEPAARARDIVALEARIAAASWTHEQMLDATATYHPMSLAELERRAPGFDWRAYLAGAGIAPVGRLLVDAESAFPKIAAVFAATPLPVLRARLAFVVADAAAPFLGRSFESLRSAFRDQTTGSGLFTEVPRAVRAEKAAEASLPDLVAALYVARYASPAVKERVTRMAELERAALDARLAGAPWLGAASREAARAKLAKLALHIGYPERFDDAAGLEIRDHDLYGNVARAAAFAWRRQVDRLGRPFDRSTWGMTPEYPNYNYVPTTNTIEIPAALLVPPFFDPAADDAVNFGAIGTVIGQVMASAFTAQGSSFDGDGRLRSWLAPEDASKLAALSAKFAERYSRIEPLPGLALKGGLLADEALADLGGVVIALDAYRAALGDREAPVLDGFTGAQRFFLGRAQAWRAKFSDNFVRNQIATGSNAPPWVRIDGPTPHVDAWYAAFGVQPGDRMYLAPEERIRIW